MTQCLLVTSQIALFNSLGVAIASDTVTTHTQGSSVKTTNNSEKIWVVGPHHLVAVASSDAVFVNGINVRNLVTEWSRDLTDPLPHIEDYPQSFLSWLANHHALATEDSQALRINQLLFDHYSYIKRRTDYLIRESGVNDPHEGFLAQVIGEANEHLKSLPNYPGCSDEMEHPALGVDGVELIEILEGQFSAFPFFEKYRDSLEAQAPLILSRVQDVPGESELAFVGFGRRDFFAKSIRLHLKGFFGNRWRTQLDDPFPSESDNSGSIAMFAQSHAIQGFLRGAHDYVINQAIDLAWDAVYQAVDNDEDEKRADAAADSLRSKLETLQWDRYVSPMLDTIGGLPLTDLASLAQSLVGIQAIRAAAETGPATVGGVIETMVISKSHGTQWINRLPGLPT